MGLSLKIVVGILCFCPIVANADKGFSLFGKGPGATFAEFGLGMGKSQTEFDEKIDYNGAATYINMSFGKTILFNVGWSGLMRAEGTSASYSYEGYNYNDLSVGWLGLGINMNRILLHYDFAFGDASHKYQDTGQVTTQYTKDKIDSLKGYRVAIMIIPLRWGKNHNLGITGQYLSLTAHEFERSVIDGSVNPSKTKIQTEVTVESLSTFLTYMKTF